MVDLFPKFSSDYKELGYTAILSNAFVFKMQCNHLEVSMGNFDTPNNYDRICGFRR